MKLPEKLQHIKKLYQELFNNSNDAIFLHSVTEEGFPGKFFEVNQMACDYLGYSRDELLVMGPADIDAEEQSAAVPKIMETLDQDKRVTFEMVHKGKNGTFIPVEISSRQFVLNGQTVVLSAVRDVTERKKIEEKLRDSEELHRTTLSNISDTVFLTNEEGSFFYICPNVAVIFGYNKEEVFSFRNIDVLLGGPLVSSDQLFHLGEKSNIECPVTDKFGKEHILLVNVKKVSISTATRLYTCRDITELKQKERELLKSETMYRELSSHLQTVREEQNAYIAREIHDDLGQSITALKMNCKMVENSFSMVPSAAPREAEETVRDMKKILDRMVKKIRALTTELRPPVLDTLGIIDAISYHIDEFTTQFGVPVSFWTSNEYLNLPEEKSLAVFRVVQEALTNAIRHGGPSQIDVTVEENGPDVIITVRDNGKGFTENSNGKTLGLFGMHERAKKAGGALSIKSVLNGGTSVVFTLPGENWND